jgi:hypothetical protein
LSAVQQPDDFDSIWHESMSDFFEDSMNLESDALTGNDALNYAKEHLIEKRVDYATWTILYADPITGQEWLQDYLYSEAQGGGVPRLRRLP